MSIRSVTSYESTESVRFFVKKFKTSSLEKTDPEWNWFNFWWRYELAPQILPQIHFFIMHLIMLDQEYLNSYDWILAVQLWDTLWNYIVIVSLFMRSIFSLKTAVRMQEDYEIIVSVSLFIITDFLLKLLPKCRK
jgi:hypothetical protein